MWESIDQRIPLAPRAIDECPADRGPCQPTRDVRLVIDNDTVVVAQKSVAQRLTEHEQDGDDQESADRDRGQASCRRWGLRCVEGFGRISVLAMMGCTAPPHGSA